MRCDQPSVVLSHAGVQYSYQVAFALQEAGFLKAFWTTLYDCRDTKNLLPRRVLNRRYHEGLRRELIHSNPWPEIFQRMLGFILDGKSVTRNQLLYWRNCWFDHSVARRLGRGSFDCLIGYSGSCLNSIRKSKEMGRWAIVDQHDIHPRLAERLLREEIDLHPDFASLISYWPPHWGYLKRVQEELELADRILVPSSFSFESHRLGGIQPEKLVRIPLGVNIPASPYRIKQEKKPFRILFVGTITQRKGVKYLLEAVKQLRLREMELVLIGQIDGDTKPLEPYRDFFRHIGFLPHEALKEYWASSDVLVLPSVYDALGVVILEAMAHGLPVIVSENTAGRDVVREGVDGYVIPIRDVEALKDRILKLYKDPELWRVMSRNASERAQEFTWAKYQERMALFLKGFKP